jgi:hypothetical protein
MPDLTYHTQIRRLRLLTIFLGCTSIALAAALAWFVVPQFFQSQSSQPRYDPDIVFPPKTFLSTDAWVGVKGTLRADWIAYKNNTFSILCLPQECLVASVDQIGPMQISSIDGPTVYPVIRWNKDEVVAQDDTLCARITITFDRARNAVLWVETPINQTEIDCQKADNTIRKATIEESLYWGQRSKIKN